MMQDVDTDGRSVAEVPGRTLGITAFVLSFFLQPVALALGIASVLQSRPTGAPNNFGLAGIIISAVLILAGLIAWIAVTASRAGVGF